MNEVFCHSFALLRFLRFINAFIAVVVDFFVVCLPSSPFHFIFTCAYFFQTDAALIYDGVLSFCHGLRAFDASREIRPANVSCDREQSWADGLSLLNYINSVCPPENSFCCHFFIHYLLLFFFSFFVFPHVCGRVLPTKTVYKKIRIAQLLSRECITL